VLKKEGCLSTLEIIIKFACQIKIMKNASEKKQNDRMQLCEGNKKQFNELQYVN